MLTPAKELRLAIDNCELPHPLYVQQLAYLEQRIEDAIDGSPGRVERIIGPSRVGKSMLINALARKFPEQKIDGRRYVPVLVVRVPTPVSPLLLPSSVLEALKVPVRRRITSGAMGSRMLEQLNLAGVCVLIFEEASHLVELGTRVPPRAAGDWFKALADSLNLTIILLGVPRLDRLFESNEQLRLRASAASHFRPYDSRIQESMQAFHTCVASYAHLFRKFGFPIELSPRALTYQCYLLTGGLIGVLSRFMQELAIQRRQDAPRSLTCADCLAAAQNIESAGSPHFRAFSDATLLESVTPAALHHAFVQVMNDNGMAVPIIKEPGEVK
ncbi:TniB family NTP-binding protein [Herbaspirillum robiniae]|uniref:TniB family NTP-binding protein n=1 Tax=Herbaspirillum robiniae TaxID=2014887 RepID=UPI003D787E63